MKNGLDLHNLIRKYNFSDEAVRKQNENRMHKMDADLVMRKRDGKYGASIKKDYYAGILVRRY